MTHDCINNEGCSSSRLHVQSVPITTRVMISNPFHGEVYSIEHCVIKFTGQLFSSDTPVRSANETDLDDITENEGCSSCVFMLDCRCILFISRQRCCKLLSLYLILLSYIWTIKYVKSSTPLMFSTLLIQS
jgi:hypothetical protein